MRIRARDILAFSLDELWRMPDDWNLEVEFDDGILKTQTRETIFSAMCWVIQKNYPDTPLLKRHHLAGAGITLSKTAHLTLLENSIFDYRDANAVGAVSTVNMEDMMQWAFVAYNDIFNASKRIQSYVTSVCILDVLEVMHHPEVRKANKRLQDSGGMGLYSVAANNDVVSKIITTHPDLKDNAINRIFKTGTVPPEQMLHCVAARGGLTDIDSTVFRDPILIGFAHGFRKLSQVMMESRSASKSLFFTGDPMKQSEYSNRNIQLSAATLQNLHQVDCGSRKYSPITIDTPRKLQHMEGMAYLDEETKIERVVGKKDMFLLGKTLPFRTVFTCQHPDRYGICVRCFGEIGYNIPAFTNIGHDSSSELQSQVTGLLMQNKHLDRNATADTIHITEFDKEYITLGEEPHTIYLKPWLKKKTFKIGVLGKEAPNLNDIFTVTNVRKLVPQRLSAMNNVFLMFSSQSDDELFTTQTVSLQVSSGNRTASFSTQMLEYMLRHKWELDDDGNYKIDMTNWDYSQPFVMLPLKHFSTVDYMKQIDAFVKGSASVKTRQTVMSFEDPVAALMAFHDLVSMKMDVLVSYLQAIILTTMVQDKNGRDYRLPMPREMGQISRYRQQMVLRSMSAAMAFQGQRKIIFSPAAFLVQRRPPHPLDFLLMGGKIT